MDGDLDMSLGISLFVFTRRPHVEQSLQQYEKPKKKKKMKEENIQQQKTNQKMRQVYIDTRDKKV